MKKYFIFPDNLRGQYEKLICPHPPVLLPEQILVAKNNILIEYLEEKTGMPQYYIDKEFKKIDDWLPSSISLDKTTSVNSADFLKLYEHVRDIRKHAKALFDAIDSIHDNHKEIVDKRFETLYADLYDAHCGDCTAVACTCSRCYAEDLLGLPVTSPWSKHDGSVYLSNADKQSALIHDTVKKICNVMQRDGTKLDEMIVRQIASTNVLDTDETFFDIVIYPQQWSMAGLDARFLGIVCKEYDIKTDVHALLT